MSKVFAPTCTILDLYADKCIMLYLVMNGRPAIQYVVVSRPLENYASVDIPKRFIKIWKTFVPGRQFTSREFCNKHRSMLPKNDKTAISTVGRALAKAAEVGILVKAKDGHIPDEFLSLRTVSFWLGQLRDNTRTNMEGIPSSTTRSSYTRHLWHFNKWLTGKTHDIHVTDYTNSNNNNNVQNDNVDVAVNTSSTITTTATTTIHKVKFKSVEDLLELLARPLAVRSDVSIIIKQYLMDGIHKDKRASTMRSTRNAILSYFKRNEQRLEISFDPASTYDNSEIIQTLTLQNVHDMLTVGSPTVTEKAVMLCKLHRGLDVSTLIDRFNFEAWEQIVRHFGTDNYPKWDLEMCPVPITLTRLKTGYTHLGFLERDAIIAIQEYLDWRDKNTLDKMSADQPLFLSNSLKPLGNGWMTNAFSRLAWKSGVQQKIGKNSWRVDSHEMRSLLKSTLIECGCRADIADHVIGHKPKDSYEKQAILYGSSVRAEYAKASHMLNIFSKAGSLQTPSCDDTSNVGDNDNNSIVNIKQMSTLLQKVSTITKSCVGDENKMAMLLNVITRLTCLNQNYNEELQSIIVTLSNNCVGNSSANNNTHDEKYDNTYDGTCDENFHNNNNNSYPNAPVSDKIHNFKNVMCCAACGLLCDELVAFTPAHSCSECGSKKIRVVKLS